MSRIITGVLPPVPAEELLPTMVAVYNALHEGGFDADEVEWVMLSPRTCSDLAKDTYSKWHSTNIAQVKRLLGISEVIKGLQIKPSRSLVDRWYVFVIKETPSRQEIIEECATFVERSDPQKPLDCIAANMRDLLNDPENAERLKQ